MGNTITLHFRWTISRGRDTYGYNICSLWVDGIKCTSCRGGGYDLAGTCFGDWIESNYPTQLLALECDEHYGLSVYGGKPVLDGGCGFASMVRIWEALGGTIRQAESRTNFTIFTIEIPGSSEFDQMVEEWRVKAECLDAVIEAARNQIELPLSYHAPYSNGYANASRKLLAIAKGSDTESRPNSTLYTAEMMQTDAE